MELLSQSQSHLWGSVPELLVTLLSPRCLQHSTGRDGSLHPPMLHPSGWLRWTQLPAACRDTSPWASPVKAAESGFVFGKTTKALKFSSRLAQLAFWWLVRKHPVMVKHICPLGWEMKVPSRFRSAGQEDPAAPWSPAWMSQATNNWCKAAWLGRRQSCNGKFTSAEDPGFCVIKDIVEKICCE